MGIGKLFHKQAKTYKNPLSPARLIRGTRIDDLKITEKPFLVQRGKDPSVVIVAFTGRAPMLMMPVYEFFDLTNSLGYSRILLRDKSKRRYHYGIDRRRPDYQSLLAFLRDQIKKLGAKQMIFIGTSAGGSAAIRIGHDLGADYVHAFGAQTGLSLIAGEKGEREPAMELAPLLKNANRKTVYYLHYCLGYEIDRLHAERVAGAPGVITLGYPGAIHRVITPLAQKGLLAKLLLIDNQKHIVAIAREFYGDDVKVTGASS